MENKDFIKRMFEEFKGIHEEYNRIIRVGDLFSIWFIKNILFRNEIDIRKAVPYYIGWK